MTAINTDKIYYLGPDGTYTAKALALFVKDLNISYKQKIPMKTIKSVLFSVDNDENSLGVIPIENSIEGIVREAIDNLIRSVDNDLKILGEMILPINHALLSKSLSKNSIKTVISHPQALAQCSLYLDENFKDIKILEERSTSAAARRVSELDDSFAAIANECAAEIFNLNILDTSINDEKDNKTRFLLIGRSIMPQTGNDKTSIVFSTLNVSGALSEVLNIFNKHSINLSYIDSRPSKRELGEYNFFIDLEGHIEDENVKTAILEMKSLINFYRFNGSYKKYGE